MQLEFFDPSANFWKLNPQMTGIFEDLYKNDKSRGKENSSRMMWGIVQLYDPNEYNPVCDMAWTDRLHEVVTHYWGQEWYDKRKQQVEELGERYRGLRYTAARKSYDAINKKMDELANLLNMHELSLENAESIFKIIGQQKSTYDMIEKIKKLVDEEEAKKNKVRGDVQLSGLESGEI